MPTITSTYKAQGTCGSTGDYFISSRYQNSGNGVQDLGGDGVGSSYRNIVFVRFSSFPGTAYRVASATMTINYNLSQSDYKTASQDLTVKGCSNITNSTNGTNMPTIYSGSGTATLAGGASSVTINVKTPFNNALSNGSECLYIYANAAKNRKKVSSISLTYTTASCTVSFNANGGSVSTSSKSVTVGATYGTLPTPTYTGHTFSGWYTAKTGGTKVTSSTTCTNTANHTLYAHWSATTYTVTFNANGGSVSTSSKTVTYGAAYGTLPTPTYTGRNFEGWYTAKTGGSAVRDALNLYRNL